jgi:hypothetical protein
MKTKNLLIPSLISLCAINAAHAIPLLAENAAQNVSTALTLYPDSDDPNLFYFMPNSSAIQMDSSAGTPMPMFGFTYWGLEQGANLANAGAYMTFTAHLVSDQNQKDAMNAFIASGKKIAAIPLLNSTIGLTPATPGAAPLPLIFNELDFAAHAGMAEDDIGVNAVLTGIGAKVFKAAIDGTDLFKADYCFQVQGLGPNFDATISIHYQRVYDDFQAHFSGGGWFTSYQINAEVEKLRQSGAVSIVINGGDETLTEYVKGVADQITAKLFTPQLQSTPTSSSSTPWWSFTSYSMSATSRDQLADETWTMKKRDLVTREFCVPVTLSGLKPYYNDVVKNADAATP